MTTQCLVLAPWMHPIQAIDWEEAVTLVYLRKADALEHHDAHVSSPSVTIQLPAVLRLRAMTARLKTDVKFSRVNVYTRDGFRCQYCAKKRPMKSLNYDHVIPRARGGKTTWDNIVTSCLPCNLKKDCRTPEEAGMRLLKRPSKPKSLPLTGTFIAPRAVSELWRPYLVDGVLEDVG